MKLSMLQRMSVLCDDHFVVNDRPRIHEDDLEIEQDEEHRHQVELHAEARLRLHLAEHAALVGGIFDRVRRPALPRSTLTSRAETAKPIATTMWRSRGRYSRIMESRKPPTNGRSARLLCGGGCPGDGGGPWRCAAAAAAAGIWPFCGAIAAASAAGRPLYFLPVFLYRAARDKILQFLVGAQAKHFFAAAGRISRAQIFVHDVEELFELE